MSSFRILVLTCMLLIRGFLPASAQSSGDPGDKYALEFGGTATYSRLMGAHNFYFHTVVRDLPFDDFGEGFGGSVSLGLQVPIASSFGLAFQLELMQLNSTRTEQYKIDYTRIYSKEWDYAGASLLLRTSLTRNLYLLSGIGLYSLVNDNFSASIYPTANPDNPLVSLQNLTSDRYYNPLRFDLKLGMGCAIALSEKLSITPEIVANIPLNNLYTPGVEDDYVAAGATTPNLYFVSAGFRIGLPLWDNTAPVIAETPSTPVPILNRTSVTGPTPKVRPEIAPIEHSLLDAPLVLHFAFDSARMQRLIPSDSERLRTVAIELHARPTQKLLIEGHTDSVGSEAYNIRLARDRAEEVEHYLMKLGVPEPQLAVISYGAAKPAGSNQSEEGRSENRRVVLRLME